MRPSDTRRSLLPEEPDRVPVQVAQRGGTQTKVSTNAVKTLRLIREYQGGEASIEEFSRELRLSRTATARALAELEDAGAITIEEE